MLLRKALIFFMDFIYPPCCLICGKINKNNLCEECERLIYSKAKFKKSIKLKRKIYFKKQIYIFKYEDVVRKLIIDYKFRDKSHLYKLFSEIIIKNKKICRNLKSYDIIIPVPIHHKRKKERGFNQSELIAKYKIRK